MKRLLLPALAPLFLAACQDLPHKPAAAASTSAAVMIEGEYDNHEQVWAAREGGSAVAPAHVVVTVEPAGRDWAIWRVHFDAAQTMDAVWALRRVDASTWLPHRAIVAAPGSGKAFDATQWAPLDACALRGSVSPAAMRVSADAAACGALVPGLGVQAALLPIAIESAGEWLHVRLYVDQARGVDARVDARRVAWFGGWAAINGAGPGAAADSRDWHMDRNIRLGSEGGSSPLLWRDGKRSGWSLALERLTYRDGNVPVLKLSVVEDAGGSTLAYAWANPEATRIGLNLGWVQIGLERSPPAARPGPP